MKLVPYFRCLPLPPDSSCFHSDS